jgi:hypothetical protein
MTNKEQQRLQIINNMCMTFRHDYGLRISEDDRMYTLMSGMTEMEARALFNDMAQIFDNDIAPLIENANRYEEGTHIPIPVSAEYAKAMILVAENYLKHNS